MLMSLLLIYLLLLAAHSSNVIAASKTTLGTKNFEDRAHLPLLVNVCLIGEMDGGGIDEGSSGHALQFISSELQKTLEAILPHYLPDSASEVEFDITYEIVWKGETVLNYYRSMLGDHKRNGVYHVSPSTISSFLHRLLNQEADREKTTQEVSMYTLPVWVVLPDVRLPPHKIMLESYGDDNCVQTFLSHVVFIDLSADACDLSDFGGGPASLLGSSTSDVWQSVFLAQDRSPKTSTYLLARLTNVVMSAAKQFIVSTIAYRSTHSAGKILCPIVFITSKSVGDADKIGDPLSHVSLSPKDISFLTKWVETFLLPHQEVQLLSATHYLEDHPQLSLALAAASRSFTAVDVRPNGKSGNLVSTEVIYLDSDDLLSELSKTGDSLCKRLLLDAGHGIEDDLLLEVESVFQNLRSDNYDSSKLERWMEENDPHNYVREAEDGVFNNRYKLSHERTKIVPVFVFSDIFKLESIVNEQTQQILTKLPLFDQTNLVSSRQNVALVMHSTAYNTHIFEPNMRAHGSAGEWTELDLSNPLQLIAEGLAGSLAGLVSPHFRTSRYSAPSSTPAYSDGEIDFTWGLGDHPFAPFSYIDEDKRFSGVLSWASRRGIVVSRSNAALTRLYHLLDRGVLFVRDINRVLSLFYSLLHRNADLKNELSGDFFEHDEAHETGTIEYHNAAIKSFLAGVFIYDIHGSNSELHIEELATSLDEYKRLFRTLLQRILDLKASIGGEDLLQMTEHLAQVEMEIHDYKDKFSSNERQIKEIFSRCEFSSKSAQSDVKKTFSYSQIRLFFSFGAAIVAFSFIMKRIQDRIQERVKKIS